MPRPKKNSKLLNIRLAISVSERLEHYCKDSRQTKTVAVERALDAFIDNYYADQRLIKRLK